MSVPLLHTYLSGSFVLLSDLLFISEIPKPDNVKIKSDLTSLSVTWSKPAGVDEVKYLLSLNSNGKCLKTLSLKSLQRSFSGLLMGKEYSVSVSTVLKKGGQSHAITKTIWTGKEHL